MSSLRRVQAAGFTAEDAVTLEAVQEAVDRGEGDSLLLPVDRLFAAYPAVTVGGKALFQARNGAPFPCNLPGGEYRVCGPGGEFLLLGRCAGGTMHTIKSFFEV